MRYAVDSDKYTGNMEDFRKVMVSLEQMFCWIERNTIIPAKLDYGYHPNRVLKVLGMAMNLKISNYFDYCYDWKALLFDQETYQDFS